MTRLPIHLQAHMSLDCSVSGCPGVNGESARLLSPVKPPVPPSVPTFGLFLVLKYRCCQLILCNTKGLNLFCCTTTRKLYMEQLQSCKGYCSIPEPGLAPASALACVFCIQDRLCNCTSGQVQIKLAGLPSASSYMHACLVICDTWLRGRLLVERSLLCCD